MPNRILYKLYKSTNTTKKFDIYIENPYTDRIKKISFGAKNYDDYTLHHDKQRRSNYRSRHQNDLLDDPLSSGFWSYYVLWGSSIDIKKNLNYTIRLCNKLCRQIKNSA